MKKFTEWAEHYGYQDTPEARADYARYVTELRELAGTTAALEQLARAADHVGEMQDILRDGDGFESMLAAYTDALDALTQALQLSLTIKAHPVDDGRKRCIDTQQLFR